MTVWIVQWSGWDDSEIEGVYASVDAAKLSQPGAEWREDSSGDFFEAGLPFGQIRTIERHEIKP